MDDIDREILLLLKQDGRMSATDIGARIGRSRAVVSARMQAMIDEGGHTARIITHTVMKTW